jgi:tyrosine-protein phosphatase YwqE
MKFYKMTLILLFASLTSCQSQDKKDSISLNYNAQTRGFQMAIQMENNLLEVTKNNETHQIELTDIQLNEVVEMVKKIDFDLIKSNVSIDDLAVDKAIKGDFELNFNGKLYAFEFDHNNAPENIQELLNKLQSFDVSEE